MSVSWSEDFQDDILIVLPDSLLSFFLQLTKVLMSKDLVAAEFAVSSRSTEQLMCVFGCASLLVGLEPRSYRSTELDDAIVGILNVVGLAILSRASDR